MIYRKNHISASDDIILNLKVLAKEKEVVRQKLAITAEKLAVTAKKLAVTAREKEKVRYTLAITAKEKEKVRHQLIITAKEKEDVRRKLAITAKKLKISYETLEKKVLERTKSLEISKAKEEAVLLSIGDGLLVTDEKGIIIIINKTAERMLGKKSSDVVGKSFFKSIILENKKGERVNIKDRPVSIALSNMDTNSNVTINPTYYYVREDGTKFPISIIATPVIFNGKVIGAIKIFRDITYEWEIDKAKTEFVSLASHQLRTPLSTVNWYAEMLLAGDVGDLNEKQKKYLSEVYRSNQRMVELVNALLDVSRLELGTFVVEPEKTDICKLAQDVVNEQKPQIHQREIKFAFLCGIDILVMQADPRLLRMVLQNLLSNSIKYTPVGGKVTLSISMENKKNILIKISDNGYGIPHHQKDRIFDKLFRADNVRNKDTDGTGLGLYIVKSIVENSGGEIWFKSPTISSKKIKGNEENRGTTFYVTLPIKKMSKKEKIKILA